MPWFWDSGESFIDEIVGAGHENPHKYVKTLYILDLQAIHKFKLYLCKIHISHTYT